MEISIVMKYSMERDTWYRIEEIIGEEVKLIKNLDQVNEGNILH
jgi:hypothetical protein